MKQWQITTQYSNQRPTTYLLSADVFKVGSFPTNDFRLPKIYPENLLAIEMVKNSNKLNLKDQDKDAKVKVAQNKVECTWKDLSIVVELLADRSTYLMEQISKSAKEGSGGTQSQNKIIWHVYKGRLVESYPLTMSASVKKGLEKYTLPISGLEFSIDSFTQKFIIFKPTGDVKSIELEKEGQSLKACWEDHVLFVSPCQEKSYFESIQPRENLERKFDRDHFWAFFILVLGLWFGFLAYLQKSAADFEIADAIDEKVAPENNKIVIEKKKEKGGGKGGGGVENAKANDPRGGSGYVDEVLVQDRQVLASAPGVLQAFANLDRSMKAVGNNSGSGIFGGQNRAQGILKALGGMMGSGGGGTGVGGVGTKGFGGGGGGGVGNGYGKGTGSGVGQGEGNSRQLVFEEGGLAIVGGLEKSEINAVVDENFSQIRYCYNRALRSNPSLKGKVVSKFVVGGNGEVLSSKIGSSTLLNPSVENCIAGRISTWHFPKPRGGGQVTVNYPFLLNKT